MKILLPVEQESDAKLIIDFVANYRWPPQTTIKILHAIDPAHHSADEREITVQAFLVQLRKKLQGLSKVAEVTTMILHDSPVNAIMHVVATWKADMIIMGYGLRGYDPGSVSKSIAGQASCSVVIIRPPIYEAALFAEEELDPVFTA
jgi:nucleotide-binding universal stress UspA family protein